MVVVTERIPVLDMIRVREALAGSRTRLIGPNSQGILAPDVCQIGVMATWVTLVVLVGWTFWMLVTVNL